MKNKNERFSKEFLSQFKNAEELDDFFSEMYKEAIQKMLEGELDNHMGYSKNQRTELAKDNYRNGTGKKKIKSKYGDMEIKSPRDRNASFDPKIVKKRQSALGKIEDTVIGLYSRGMSTRDIEEQIMELYEIKLSDTEVSRITNKLLEEIKQWQNRPLERFYPVIWLDAIHIKVKENYRITSKAIYIIVGINTEGHKVPLSIWIEKNESSTFWMKMLDDLKARGVEDIIIAVSDNLSGLTKAISTVFPKSMTQICIVHQIRNSFARIARKDKKDFIEKLKDIYKAPNEQQAAKALDVMDIHFGKKYPWVINSWKKQWENLTAYFQFPTEVRKLIYTTNIIENLNRNIRKYTKIKTMFPNNNAALKATFLAIHKTEIKWQMKRISNWQLVMAQLEEMFPDRMLT